MSWLVAKTVARDDAKSEDRECTFAFPRIARFTSMCLSNVANLWRGRLNLGRTRGMVIKAVMCRLFFDQLFFETLHIAR
jgi:hypothetical protein